jgi:hypothetical protein
MKVFLLCYSVPCVPNYVRIVFICKDVCVRKTCFITQEEFSYITENYIKYINIAPCLISIFR